MTIEKESKRHAEESHPTNAHGSSQPNLTDAEPLASVSVLLDIEPTLQAVFHLSPAPRLLIEPETGNILDANSAALELYGHPMEQLRRMRIQDINTLSEDEAKSERDAAMNEGRRFSRFQHRVANGQIRDVEVYVTPIEIDGTPLLCSLVHDVTEIYRQQALLQGYKAIFDKLPLGVFHYMHGESDTLQEVNPGLIKMLHAQTKEQLIGHEIQHFFLNREDYNALHEALLTDGHLYNHELSLKTLDDQIIDASITAQANPMPPYGTSIEGIVEDITDRKRAEAEQRLMAKAFQTSQAIMITDTNGIIVRINPAFSRITGYSADEVIGHHCDLLYSGVENNEGYRDIWAIARDEGHWEGETRKYRKDGDSRPLWETLSVIHDDEGRIEYYVSVFHDISRQKHLEGKLKYLATHDSLTGLYNRSRFYELLNQAHQAFVRYSTVYSLIMLDIDHFKRVNDNFGHQVGDQVLREVSGRVANTLRDVDHFCRWGGEEFMILASHTSRDGARLLAERIRRTVATEPFETVGTITVSIGVSTVKTKGALSEIEQAVDQALYSAKESGRNRIATTH